MLERYSPADLPFNAVFHPIIERQRGGDVFKNVVHELIRITGCQTAIFMPAFFDDIVISASINLEE